MIIQLKKSKKGGALNLVGMGEMKGKQLPPGVSFTSSGKIKKDRYSVYYGYYKKTSGGLTKDDFIKKGNKIVSKRKSMINNK